MQAAPSRRKGSAATESEARASSAPRNPTPNRSQSANRRAAALGGNSSNANANGGDAQRSGSQPKQRSGTRSASTGRSTTSSSTNDKTVPTQTPFEAALARVKKTATGKSEAQLELMLQQLLQQRQFEDAAYLIAASPSLEVKYKTSDVIRLLLDIKQFDKAAQLIRDMKLHTNQLLVTLFIKELVRASLFQAAVRYAQEMVPNFGKTNEMSPRDPSRPSWTPQALIQAMIRAQQYRSALKYAKQFELLDMFPPTQLIASMFEVRSWDEAVSSVLEFRLFKDFPLDVLVQKLLENRQWSNAVKCINKLPTQEMIETAYEALVREAARVGDFVTSLRYLREFKLDQPDTNGLLLKYFVDCMIAHGEFYKAIKYAIKFGMNLPPPDAEETGEVSVYDTEVLIRKAIDCGQYHVAQLYIKKLKLKDRFAKELELIKQQQERMLQEFHQFMAARSMQYQHPHIQAELSSILGGLVYDEKVDQTVEAEVVLSLEEEIFPRKPRESPANASTEQVPDDLSVGEASTASLDGASEAPRKSSRFSFARADSGITAANQQLPLGQSNEPLQPTRTPVTRAPPPGLVPPSAPPVSSTDSPGGASSFDFAHFVSSLQTNQGGMSSGAPPPPPPQPQQGLSHLFPHQAPSLTNLQRTGGGFYPPPSQQFNGASNQHGFPGPPPPPPPPPPSQQQQQQPPPPMPMYYQSSQQSFSHPPPPPPPNGSMPPHYMGSNGGSSNGNFDISSLAMQFHARPQGPTYSAGYNQFGRGAPPPPPMPPGMPGGLFPSMGPPMQGFPPQPQSQPQFSFKPTVSYTSVKKQ